MILYIQRKLRVIFPHKSSVPGLRKAVGQLSSCAVALSIPELLCIRRKSCAHPSLMGLAEMKTKLSLDTAAPVISQCHSHPLSLLLLQTRVLYPHRQGIYLAQTFEPS